MNKRTTMTIIGLIVFLLAICSNTYSQTLDSASDSLFVRRHAISIKTNILYDAFYMPNYGFAPMPDVELEFFPRSGRMSVVAGFTFPYWQKEKQNKYFQIRDYRLEARWYFSQTDNHIYDNSGFYLGIAGNYNEYGIGFSKTKGWQGEGWGGGLTAGYVQRLDKTGRWRIEYSIGAGYYQTRFDPYVYGNPITGSEDGDYYYDYTGLVKDFHRRNHRRKWFGPTSVGVTISYDLFYFKAQKKGLGTHRQELLMQSEEERKEMAR